MIRSIIRNRCCLVESISLNTKWLTNWGDWCRRLIRNSNFKSTEFESQILVRKRPNSTPHWVGVFGVGMSNRCDFFRIFVLVGGYAIPFRAIYMVKLFEVMLVLRIGLLSVLLGCRPMWGWCLESGISGKMNGECFVLLCWWRGSNGSVTSYTSSSRPRVVSS